MEYTDLTELFVGRMYHRKLFDNVISCIIGVRSALSRFIVVFHNCCVCELYLNALADESGEFCIVV